MRTHYKPQLECLESRTVPSISFDSSTRTVSIQGDDRVDVVRLHQSRLTADPNNWTLIAEQRVMERLPNGRLTRVEYLSLKLPRDDVLNVVFDGQGENDEFIDFSWTDSAGNFVNCEIYGGAGNDYLVGGNGDDLIVGGAGNDLLGGGSGNSVMVGGAGQDRLYGSGLDILVGGHGRDEIHLVGEIVFLFPDKEDVVFRDF